ncbi:BSD domain-containing protein [Euphorbia peplus]|nr:BSD domain-containing protein [Euphorbia peplus]
MSWLARSLANSLRLEEDEEEDDHQNDVHPPQNDIPPNSAEQSSSSHPHPNQQPHSPQQDEEAIARGVKEDLSEFSQTLTRQLWGVASFLAPPPPTSSRSPDRFQEPGASDSEGIRRDFGEIGGRFRTGVTEISKMASNYFPFGSQGDNEVASDRGEGGYREEEEEQEQEQELVTDEYDECDEGAIGITDEVLAFARNIAMHPETWLDFPLDQEEDLDDFDMSDSQREHALTVEQLAPRLAALRIELCPCHMTDSYFWKVYFVLLHSRLGKHDAEILSTPQVMEARAMWMKELHKETKHEDEWFGTSTSFSNRYTNTKDFATARTFDSDETDKHPVLSGDLQFIDKSVITEKPVIKFEERILVAAGPYKPVLPNYEDDEDEDDWPDEEDSDLGSYKATTMGNEEDISFSDLEDDANYTMPIKSNTLTKGTETSKS